MAELADTLTVTDDDRLDQAESVVRDYCGWHIAPLRTESVTVAGLQGRTIILPSLNVTSVASVTIGDTELAATDYDCTQSGVLTLATWWCGSDWYGTLGGSRAVTTVVFTHGYQVPPPSVTRVVQALAARANTQPVGLQSRTVGAVSETYAGDPSLTPGELADLGRYRLPALP